MSKVRIAVLDQSPLTEVWLQKGFQRLGEITQLELDFSTNTMEFLQKLSHNNWDMVIVGTPNKGATSVSVLKKIRSTPSYNHIPIYYLCSQFDKPRQKELDGIQINSVFEKTTTTPLDIQKIILDQIQITTLHFNKITTNEIKEILVVDDSLISRKLVVKILASQNYTVYEAEDGIQGLEVFDRECIDLVLTDFEMPKMGGLEMCLKIKSQDTDVPVIGMTAHNKFEAASAAQEHQMDGLIQKPINRESLFQMIPQNIPPLT